MNYGHKMILKKKNQIKHNISTKEFTDKSITFLNITRPKYREK